MVDQVLHKGVLKLLYVWLQSVRKQSSHQVFVKVWSQEFTLISPLYPEEDFASCLELLLKGDQQQNKCFSFSLPVKTEIKQRRKVIVFAYD